MIVAAQVVEARPTHDSDVSSESSTQSEADSNAEGQPPSKRRRDKFLKKKQRRQKRKDSSRCALRLKFNSLFYL